jgi:hypothetical protein
VACADDDNIVNHWLAHLIVSGTVATTAKLFAQAASLAESADTFLQRPTVAFCLPGYSMMAL